MSTQETLSNFTFESREEYDRARKEADVIAQIQEKTDLSDAKTALKIYNKAVADKLFETPVGYCFLFGLRQYIIGEGTASSDMLKEIPIKVVKEAVTDTIPEKSYEVKRFQKLYEGQKILNKKFKIALVAMVILVIGFITINFSLQYSVFTYFTDYKSNMEEEIINKYEHWEEELEKREEALKQ